MLNLGVVFTPLNRFLADEKKHLSHFFVSSLTYFSFIKIGGGHLGRFPCQYMPSEPAKYSITVWWICDTTNSFLLKGIIYIGNIGNTRDVNHG